VDACLVVPGKEFAAAPPLYPSLRGANGSRECAPDDGSATKQSILSLPAIRHPAPQNK
jgi:hypothetical protein